MTELKKLLVGECLSERSKLTFWIVHFLEVYEYEEKDIVVMMDGVGESHLEPNSENIVGSKDRTLPLLQTDPWPS